jgi:hypothetical protein
MADDEFTPIPKAGALGGSALKDAVLNEARASSMMMYKTLLVQAQRVEIVEDRLILTFAASFKYSVPFEKYKSALAGIASKLAGRNIKVEADGSGADPAPEADATGPQVAPKSAADVEKQAALKEQVMADTGVQALLEVFPAEIRDVEEM